MSQMKVGTNVPIYSFKHDGSFHRLWENTVLIEQTEDYIVVGNVRAKVTESDGRFWEAREPAITIFSTKGWFNVICMIRATGIHYYCNIASPTQMINEEIVYIDYDLDVSMAPDNTIRILDEGEYHKHAEQMKYSPELDYELKKALYEVLRLCRSRQYPFSNQKVNEYYRDYQQLLKNK